MIDDGYGGALRADLRHFYGLDLVDVWRGRLSPRAVRDFVEHIPDDSALQAAMRGGREHRGWTVGAYLAAAEVDSTNDVAWITASANSKRRIAQPERLHRPASPTKTPTRKRPRLASLPGAKPLPVHLRRG